MQGIQGDSMVEAKGKPLTKSFDTFHVFSFYEIACQSRPSHHRCLRVHRQHWKRPRGSGQHLAPRRA